MEETQTPLQVSVIVVSYNCAQALRRCLTALEASAERDKMEILVVDNGSFDETPDAAAEFPQVILLKLPRNFGFTRALNIGMRTAKGEFYFYVSPYVEAQPGTVAALAARLAAEPDAAAVCPLLLNPQGEPSPELYALPGDEIASIARSGAFAPAAPPDLAQEKVAVQFPSLAALMVRGYFMKGLRYIDERYAQTWADAELALQIRRSGKKILLYPGIRATNHHAERLAEPLPSNVRTLLASDWALGASVYAGKHSGFMAGLKVRLLAILGALVSFQFGRLIKLISGSKVDGTQSVM